MPSIITAGTTTGTALSLTSDTSGELQIRTNNGSTTALTLTTGGNIEIPGTGKRITGDMSNATVANRIAFQTSITNGNTTVQAYPNGTSGVSGFQFYDGTDPTNAASGQIIVVRGESLRIHSNATGTASFLPITIATGGSERMRIDTSGNVGIGTSSPLSLLHLNKASGASDIRLSVAGTLYGTAYASAADFTINSVTAIPLTLGTNNTERMRIDSSGNVGIGTASPTYPLTVGNNRQIGGLNSSGAGVTFAIVNGSNNLVFGDDSVNTGQLTIQSRSNMVFSLNTAERARITSGGQLLVGASSARDANIIGIQNGDGFVERDFLDSGGTSRTIVVSGEFNYWFEITVMCIGNSNNSQIGEGRWIAGRRDYGGAAHIFSNSSLVNTCIAFSTSQSIVGNRCTYTITVTNTQDGANKHWLTKVRLVNSNSFSLS